MNLKEAKALARTLYFTNTGRTDLDELQFRLLLNVANGILWRDAVRSIGTIFGVDSPDVTTTAGKYNYSSLASNGVYQIQMVCAKSTHNAYVPLDFETMQDRGLYNTGMPAGDFEPTAYTLLGESIVLLPATNAAKTIRITYVPNLSDLLLETDELLSGKLEQYHELVVFDALMSALPTQLTGGLSLAAGRMHTQWNAYMTSRQHPGGRHIRYVPY